MAIHFADTVRACSGGRLNIKVFPTGAIVPAMEIFEATSKGTLDAFHSWPGYWKGRNEAFVAYASVPFGLDNEGYNIWYYERGGKEIFDELYGRFGMVPFFCGNVGQEIGMHSNKRATKLEDFKGMKVRTVGWYMDILTKLGVSVTPLPGPEVYLALERGVVDGYGWTYTGIDVFGWNDVTKFVIDHPFYSLDGAILISKQAWDKLPPDVQTIMNEIGAKLKKLGLQYIQFSAADAARYVKTANEAGWKDFIEKNDAAIKANPGLLERLQQTGD
jgi:TRAP-type mannitol/chloroaromatic compound transport system substrate-binding protein